MAFVDWVYFATEEGVSRDLTLDLASRGYLWRAGFRKDRVPIPKVPEIGFGHRLLLCYQGVPEAVLEVLPLDGRFELADPVVFPALGVVVDQSLHLELEQSTYAPDPILNTYCGFHVRLHPLTAGKKANLADWYNRPGRNAIHSAKAILGEL